MADRGYKASCATEEEPNGPQDDPDPYYSYRATEVVQTQLGQEVAVTRCGRYYRNAGNLVTTPEDDCTTEKRIVHAGEFTVLCHLLEDFREVPGYDDGQLEEVGWKEIYIKLSPRPTRARCDDSKEFESEDPRILSIYHEYDLVYWQAPEFLLVTQCDCFEDHGNGESPTPGCTTRPVSLPSDQLSGEYEVACRGTTFYEDGGWVDWGCRDTYYRTSLSSGGLIDED